MEKTIVDVCVKGVIGKGLKKRKKEKKKKKKIV